MPTNDDDNDKSNNSVARLNITQLLFRMHGGRAGKVGPSAKVGPCVTAFLACNVVKATVVVSTDIRRICFFGTNAKR